MALPDTALSPRERDALGDYTADARLLLLAALAIVAGLAGGAIAWLLLRLIGLITNVSFYQRLSFAFTSPAHERLGWLVFVPPVIGGLLIGLIARFGSEKIRGHGIPEAIEAILAGGSNIPPRIALLKPLASAIAIGTGGPFGAEGPIIMTGGAFGSLFAQCFRLSAMERKTILVAGAAAGMAGIFGTPVAATLIAVELLLFEWKPRSFVPVAVAAATATVARIPLLGSGPLFPCHSAPLPTLGVLLCVPVGVAAGLASGGLTWLTYFFEDQFRRLPLHWMWWPALAGLLIGAAAMIEPDALGVGYDVIRALLAGRMLFGTLALLLVVKTLLWASTLGSGTSGGVLAPLLIIGGALGAMGAHALPVGTATIWALIGMTAVLGGTMRSPFTAIVFALELTHDVNALLPLMVATFAAAGCTVLVLKRSILTEKIARHGRHVIREYAVDPLEKVLVEEVMTRVRRPYREAAMPTDAERRSGANVGAAEPPVRAVARPGEPMSGVADRMAMLDLAWVPVVEPSTGTVVGIVTRHEVLRARAKTCAEEHERARGFAWRRAGPRRAGPRIKTDGGR